MTLCIYVSLNRSREVLKKRSPYVCSRFSLHDIELSMKVTDVHRILCGSQRYFIDISMNIIDFHREIYRKYIGNQ